MQIFTVLIVSLVTDSDYLNFIVVVCTCKFPKRFVCCPLLLASYSLTPYSRKAQVQIFDVIGPTIIIIFMRLLGSGTKSFRYQLQVLTLLSTLVYKFLQLRASILEKGVPKLFWLFVIPTLVMDSFH